MYIYEVCLKSNGTGVTNSLFQFQTTNGFPFKVIPSSLMHFSILLCHASMHCWKDSSGMPLSSAVTALLMASTPSKRVPLMIPLSLGKRKSHTEQDQVNRKIVPVRRCSSQPGTAGCAGRFEQGHCCGEAATICPATTLVSSRALSEANITGSLCRLALWQELTVDDASDIEERDQHDFDF